MATSTSWRFPWNAPLRTYTRTLRGKRDTLYVPKLPYAFDIGRNSYVNDDARVDCYRPPARPVHIGKYCSIGRCVFVVDGDHAVHHASTFPFREFGLSRDAPENRPADVTAARRTPRVGNDVWIADGATLMDGVTVHDGAIVAGNAVVTMRDVPPYAVVAGNPARVVKFRFEDALVSRFLEAQWWDLPDDIVHQRLAPLNDDPRQFLEKAEYYRELLLDE